MYDNSPLRYFYWKIPHVLPQASNSWVPVLTGVTAREASLQRCPQGCAFFLLIDCDYL